MTTNPEDVRGSAPAMTTKDLLLEVYHDMKFVRPAVETLMAAGVVQRIEAIERSDVRLEASGVTAGLVDRVAALEQVNKDRGSAETERRRIGDLTNRSVVFAIVITNFIIGVLIAVSNVIDVQVAAR